MFYSLMGQINESVHEMACLLAKVPDAANASKDQIQMEVDRIIQPLMDFLDGNLTDFAQLCDKTVLRRLLKVGPQLQL